MLVDWCLFENTVTGLPILPTQMASVTSCSHLVDMQGGPREGNIYMRLRREDWERLYKHYHKWVTLKEMTPHPQRAVRREAKMR